MKKQLIILILTGIILIGGFLRIYNIANAPPSLNWDEAAWGYNAYSILSIGKDEYGKVLPIFTRSFDEYKSTLPMYLMVPSIKMFGLNAFAVRLPSVLVGVASILVIYLLAKEIFDDQRIALVSSFLFAIEPWAVHLSRVYYDANEAMFFLLLGLLLFLKSLHKEKLFTWSVASFMVSMYTYNSDKVLAPLFLAVLIILHHKKVLSFSRKTLYTSLVIFAAFVVPFIYLAFKGQTFARLGTTNILILWPQTQVLQTVLLNSHLNGFWNFIIHNNVYYFVWEIMGRYIGYFSPYNLFIREPQEPSTIIAGNSIFYAFEFVPWTIGLFCVFKNAGKYKNLVLLILLSVLPAVVTWNWFQPGRVMALLACFSIVISVGLNEILKILPKKLVNVCLLAFVIYSLVSALYLFESINVYSPYRDPGNYQPGFKETVPEVMKIETNYSQVIIDTPQAQPYIFYLFYGKYNPKEYLSELDLNYIGTPRKHFDFGKYHFRKINWVDDKNLKNTLFVGGSSDFPGVKPLMDIKDKFGNTINYLVATN
jgi:4-amino-4-deoxy-L-arabinose transferase-like glycosyltransferase